MTAALPSASRAGRGTTSRAHQPGQPMTPTRGSAGRALPAAWPKSPPGGPAVCADWARAVPIAATGRCYPAASRPPTRRRAAPVLHLRFRAVRAARRTRAGATPVRAGEASAARAGSVAGAQRPIRLTPARCHNAAPAEVGRRAGIRPALVSQAGTATELRSRPALSRGSRTRRARSAGRRRCRTRGPRRRSSRAPKAAPSLALASGPGGHSRRARKAGPRSQPVRRPARRSAPTREWAASPVRRAPGSARLARFIPASLTGLSSRPARTPSRRARSDAPTAGRLLAGRPGGHPATSIRHRAISSAVPRPAQECVSPDGPSSGRDSLRRALRRRNTREQSLPSQARRGRQLRH